MKVLFEGLYLCPIPTSGFSNAITICGGSGRMRAGPEVNDILLLKELKLILAEG
jgi:hypothetical protein